MNGRGGSKTLQTETLGSGMNCYSILVGRERNQVMYFKRVHEEPYHFEVYYEFDDQAAMRQTEIHPETVLLLAGFSVTEANQDEFEFTPDERIDQTEFEELWGRLSRRPHGTRRSDSPILKKYLWGVPRRETP